MKYYLEYLKMTEQQLFHNKDEQFQSPEQQKHAEYIQQENIKIFQNKMKEIAKLGVNTHSLVLIWASFKSLT